MKKLTFSIAAIFALMLIVAEKAAAQGFAVNNSGIPAHSSAILDVNSTTQGVLVPRMTSAQRSLIATPAMGLLVYQTDGVAGFYFYDGTAWHSLNAFATAGGDLTGTYPNPTLTATGVPAGSYGSATQVGTFSVDAKGRLTSAGNTTITGVTPGGAAGGDLNGTYPNPTVAANSITTAKIADNSVTTAKIAAGNVTSSTIADNNVITSKIADNNVTTAKLADASVTVPKINASGLPTSFSFLRGDGTWSVPAYVVPGGTAGGELAGTYPNPVLTTTGVAAGSYGSATEVPSYTVDSKGRITGASNITITGTTPGGAAGGELAGTYPNPVLTTTGVAAGSYGNSTQVPSYTVDSKGRITAASNITIAGTTPGGAAGGELAGTYPNPVLTTTGVGAGSYGSATQVPAYTVDSKGRITGAYNITITGTTPGGSAGGDLTNNYPNPTLVASGVTSGTYGNATQVPAYTVDAKGRIIAASNITITGTTPGGSAGGDLTGTYPNPTLASSGVTSGTYGSSSQVPAYTVDSKGRITAASNITITGTTPGGSAGGDLTGTYPNPTVANSAITSAKILDGTIQNGDISTTAAIAYSKLNLTGSVGITDHSATGAASSTTFLRGDNTWATPSSTPGGAAGGDLTGTYPNPTLATSGVTSGTYGSSTQVPAYTVDTKGRITAASNVTITGTTPGGSAGGDLTGTYPSPTLAASGVTSGTYGSSTQVPAYTVDTKGRITAASNVTITGTTPGGSAGGDLTGTYPNPTVANNAITSAKILDGTIANSDVSTTAAIAYSKLNLAGSVGVSDHSATGTASSSTFLRGDNTWATPSASPTGSAGGDLTGTYPNPTLAVSGVTSGTYGSSTQVPAYTVDSKGRITAASNITITGTTPGGSAGGDLTGTYPNPTVANSAITSAKILDGTIANSDVSTTAAIAYSKLNLAGSVGVSDHSATGTASSTTFLRGDNTWATPTASPSGSAGGDLTGTYPNPTLATSGVTSGTYGSATQVPAYTVDSKGRITAASNITITGTTPGGSAGGDLTGTYPNPTVANSAITSAKILDGTIANADVSTTAAIAYSKLNLAGSVGVADHSATGTASSATFLRGDNTWATPTASPSGSAGGDLTGTYPNPTLAVSGVTSGSYGSSTQVPAYTVDSKGRITAASNITITGTTPGGSAGGDLTGTYPNPTVANSAITSAKILDGTITNSDVSTTASIAYSKLNLASSVAMTDLSATGTRSSSTFLRGDGAWATPSGGSGATNILVATQTGSQSCATSSATTIPFDNVITTPSSGSFSSGTYTASASGLYLITFSLAGTANAGLNAQILQNGSVIAVAGATNSTNFPSTSVSRSNCTVVCSLASGDTITLQGYNSNSATSNTVSTDGTTRVTITKLN